MGTKNSFNLPKYSRQSVSPARNAYQIIWNCQWPYDDQYLRELAAESGTCEQLLVAMRECHDFSPK